MITKPSLQKPVSYFVTCDPAIIPSDGSDEWRAKIAAARETGDWTTVLIEGAQPTKFLMGQVDRNIWRSIMDRAVLPHDSPRRIGPTQLAALLFRLSVREISDFESFARLPDPVWDNWTMAPGSVVTQLDEISPAIVGELGDEIFKRLSGAGPLAPKG